VISSVNALFNHPGLRAFLVRLRLPIGIAVAALLVYFADPRWLWPGFLISAVGLFIQLWCFATLNKNASLACRGPYAIVRNPMYLGRSLIVFGALLLLGNPWILLVYVLGYGFYMVNRVKREEKRLRILLGEPYADYCRETNRFLPGAPYRGEPVLVWDWTLFGQNHGWVNMAGTLAFWVLAIAWIATRQG